MTIITAILPAYNEEISVLHSKQHVGRVVVDDGSRYITIKPQMKAPRVTPLEGVSTYAPQGIRVRGVENPQGFGMMNADADLVTLHI